MANINTKAHIFVRDSFTCQVCGALLLLPQAIKLLDQHVPALGLYHPHGKMEPLRSRWATVDHVVSEFEGGMDTLENLVACCIPCNSRKGGTTGTLPVKPMPRTTWDGLSGLFLALAERFPMHLSHEDKKWLVALRREGIEANDERLASAAEILQEVKARGMEGFDEGMRVGMGICGRPVSSDERGIS